MIRRTFVPVIAAAVGYVLVACAPAAPPARATAVPAAKPTAAPAQPTAAPAAATTAPAKADTTVPAEWERVLAAARQEGTVAMIGPTGADRRASLVENFVKQYGIPVEYLGDAGAGVAPRVSNERQAGQFLWDVTVVGTTTGIASLIPMGALDPLDSALLLPEVTNPQNWRGGSIEYTDDTHRMLVMTPSQRGTLFVNPNTIKEGDISSYKDLLDPKYKGKLVMHDPRVAGPGQATFTFFYMHPDLGPNFIRDLAKQEITAMRDYLAEIDSVARGDKLVIIGNSDPTVEERQKLGVPITMLDPRTLKEGSDVSPGSGGLGMFNRAPHPNAAKVYINWLLSKEGQTEFARVNGYISARLDVPTDHAPRHVPIPGSIKTYTKQAIDQKDDLLKLVAEVFT